MLLRLETEIKLEPFEARSRSLPFVRDYYSTLLPGWYTQTHTYFAQAHIHTHTHTLSARHSLGRRRSRIRLWRDNSARKHYFDYTAFCCCSSSSTYFTFLFPFVSFLIFCAVSSCTSSFFFFSIHRRVKPDGMMMILLISITILFLCFFFFFFLPQSISSPAQTVNILLDLLLCWSTRNLV